MLFLEKSAAKINSFELIFCWFAASQLQKKQIFRLLIGKLLARLLRNLQFSFLQALDCPNRSSEARESAAWPSAMQIPLASASLLLVIGAWLWLACFAS